MTLDLDLDLILAITVLVGMFIADTAVSKRGGRYAVALHRLIVLLAGTVVPGVFLSLAVIDSRIDLPWWNLSQGWGSTIVAAVLFPLMLVHGGWRLPGALSAYRRERDIRTGKLVRVVENYPGGTMESVLTPAVAAYQQQARASREAARQRRKDFPLGSS